MVSPLVYERLFYYCCYSLLDHNSGHNCIIMTGIMIHTFQYFFQLKCGKTFENAMSINPIIDGHTKVEVLVIWICTLWSQGFTICQTERKFVKHQNRNCNKPIITIFWVTYIYWKLFWGHCVVKNLSTKSFLITTYYLITSPLPPLVPHH